MPETVRHYKKLADEERALHRAQHPDYRFRPKRQKSAGQAGRSRSPKRRTSSPGPKRVAGRSSSVSVECNQASRNDPLQIQTIIVPTSSSTLSQSHLSRQPTPDFFHGYGSATPTSPCSPLSPVDDTLYMPRPTIAGRSDSLMSYTADDSQVSVWCSSPRECGSDDRVSSMAMLRTLSHPSQTTSPCLGKHSLPLIQHSCTTIPRLPPLPPRW